MPELPEVETTLRALIPALLGKKFGNIEVLRRNMILHDPSFEKRLRGKTVTSLKRHGKYLCIALDNDATLVLHLKMSGRMGLRKRDDTELRYERIRFEISAEELLVFNDPRTLGRAWILETEKLYDHPSIKRLGPDAIAVTKQEFIERLRKKRGILKAVLLDQSFVSGIGNIYADESCFLAGLRPTRMVASLVKKEQERLFYAVIKTLQQGIDNMGTSFSDFADLFGKPGQNQNSLMVYGRAGAPCRRCKTVLSSCKVGQRTTVWCGKCQK